MLSFVKLSNFPKIQERSLDPVILREKVAESKNENDSREKKDEGKISPDEETLTPLKNPSSSKNQIDPGKILILDFGVVGRG